MSVASEILRARTERRLTKAHLAKQLGVHPSFVTRLEKGAVRPSLNLLSQLGKVLGLDPEKLLIQSGHIPPRFSAVAESSPGLILSFLQDGTSTLREPTGAYLTNQVELSLGTEAKDPYSRFLPKEIKVADDLDNRSFWQIDQTISELSYLSHNFFRYYGKFPATIPKALLGRYPVPKGEWLLDNFCGSGTSLVEAQIAGTNSIGIDVNPVAVLAGRVKTRHYDIGEIERILNSLVQEKRHDKYVLPKKSADAEALLKWISTDGLQKLCSFGCQITTLDSHYRDFFSCALLAILRRCTVAYDGEVRPHRNPLKRPQDPLIVFPRKVRDMMDRLCQMENFIGRNRAAAEVVHGDCRNPETIHRIGKRRVGLVISHPPYLNCFDYAPVYRLELALARLIGLKLEDIDFSYDLARSREVRAWPAKDLRDVQQYLTDLCEAYENLVHFLAPSGRVCVVVGDCTMQKKLVPVHSLLTERMISASFRLRETIYRTTHYGIGKYAYDFRADYHGEAAEKKDAILVFELK